ncbi:hypothetical protein K2173_020025 [Erythroxylum novogranatense]|uniref:Uncharacterized protein n=1 Tax=Erythroxylum novogranatense TaxID=1862640 RepID=A0AAV8U813_9ROSI|nr:hypothetical protein K2173_020025 [Erythroxylum novogranatense]
MASYCGRFMARSSLLSIKSAIRSSGPKSSIPRSASSPSKPLSSPPRSFSFSTRARPELGCVQSLLPFHSTVAAARMTSCLSTNSRSCRALSQGTLCCTSPGL